MRDRSVFAVTEGMKHGNLSCPMMDLMPIDGASNRTIRCSNSVRSPRSSTICWTYLAVVVISSILLDRCQLARGQDNNGKTVLSLSGIVRLLLFLYILLPLREWSLAGAGLSPLERLTVRRSFFTCGQRTLDSANPD